jgi:hypothetical protein
MQEQKKAQQTEDLALRSMNTDTRKTMSPQRESTRHGTASQCPLSAHTDDDVNVTTQTDWQQYNLRRWLMKAAELASKKRKDNMPRSGSHRELIMRSD